MCLGQTCPSRTWEYGIFPILSLVSIHPSLPKIRYSRPNNKYFSEISKTRANTSQSFSVWSLKVWWLWQAFENGLFFGQIMLNDSENHLNKKWLNTILNHSLNSEPLPTLISGLNPRFDYATLCVLNQNLVSQNFVLKSYQKLSRKNPWGGRLDPPPLDQEGLNSKIFYKALNMRYKWNFQLFAIFKCVANESSNA